MNGSRSIDVPSDNGDTPSPAGRDLTAQDVVDAINASPNYTPGMAEQLNEIARPVVARMDTAYRIMVSVDGGPWKIARSKTCKGIYDKKHFAFSAMNALKTMQESMESAAKRYDRLCSKREYKVQKISGTWHDM